MIGVLKLLQFNFSQLLVLPCSLQVKGLKKLILAAMDLPNFVANFESRIETSKGRWGGIINKI